MLYSLFFRLVFARFDPEFIHHVVATGLRVAGFLRITRLGFIKPHETETVAAFGLNFNGRFGLAAGFDKNAKMIRPLGDLGFSHVEIGTVTRFAQPGNDKPRLFRLTKDRALINRMGFNNDGCDAVAERLRKLRLKNPIGLPIIGVNIGKSKITPLEEAAEDYRHSAKALAPFADYIAVNVSSPNTPGLRSLQDVSSLRPILEVVLQEAKEFDVPVLVKIAPDLANEDIVEIARLAAELKLDGIIATNTTITRTNLETDTSIVEKIGAGGLSGAPLRNRSLEVLRILSKEVGGVLTLVAVGGIETSKDAKERIDAGATLVQGYTGFVYEGPFWARKINRELDAR